MPATSTPKSTAIRGAGKLSTSFVAAARAMARVPCHPTVPNLAGQHRTYLFSQLANLRNGAPGGRLGNKVAERHHPAMSAHAVRLSDTDISDIAAFVNRLPCAAGPGADEVIRPIVADKCDLCHGVNGNSPFIAIPVITGQHEAYIASELENFRFSARTLDTQTHERTHRFASAAKMDLTDEQIADAAKFYSRLSCR